MPPTSHASSDRIDDLLVARAQAPSVAIHDLATDETLSWREWARGSSTVASDLAAAGVGAGHRIAIAFPRSPQYMVALLACWRVGAVAVPLDPLATPAELDGFVRHAQARAVIVPGADGRATVRSLRCAARRSPVEDALILYTSGSTGPPKGACLTHSGVLSSLRGLQDAYHLDTGTRLLGTLPLFTSHGLFVHGLSTLVHGGTLLLAPPVGAFTARATFATAAPHRPTFFSAVPAVLSLLARMSSESPPAGMVIATASAPFSEEARMSCEASFGRQVLNSFGMSEACGWFLYGQEGQPPASVGRPTRCEIRLHEQELLVRGAQVTRGYWRHRPGDIDDGWLRTGDLARLDADGWVYCIGRRKRVIHRAGRSIHPEDIEAVLVALPGVHEAVVVGVRHDILGEAPVALVLGEQLEPQRLFAALRERLSAFRLPLSIEIVESLPRTRSGKPDLQRCEALAAGRLLARQDAH